MKYNIILFLFLSSHSFSQNSINANYQDKDFILNYRCKNCNGGKIFISRSRPCQNCNYWTKDQRRFNYCNVCRNNGVIYGKNSIIACKFCKQTGVLSSKINIKFKPLFEKYFDLDDTRHLGQDAMIYSLNSEGGKLTFLGLIDFNTLQFLCFSSGSRYLFQFKSNGDIIPIEFENHLEKSANVGNWEVYDNTFEMTVPFKLKSYIDDRTLKLVKKL